MIFLSVGLPGRFATWCDAIIAGLAGARGGSVSTGVWPPIEQLPRLWPVPNALDGIATKLIGNRSEHLVIGLRHPDDPLYAALEALQTRFVVALDDPRVAVTELLEASGAELAAATRVVASCCALTMRLAALPGALALKPDCPPAGPQGAVAAVAAHFGLAASKTCLARIARQLAANRPDSGATALPAAISGTQWQVIDGAVGSYAERFTGGGFGRVLWRRELFAQNTEGYPRPTGIIDIAGPPRPLIFGPYIQLPPGRWSARVIFGVSPQGARCTFLVDASADQRQLAHAVFVPGTGGVHAVDLDFAIEPPMRNGLEIRVMVTSEGAAGQMALGHVMLQPVAMRQPEAFRGSEDFASVLAL